LSRPALGKNVPIQKITKAKRGRDGRSGKYLPSKHVAQSSNLSKKYKGKIHDEIKI
jgi:hypothetical protein